MTTSHPSETLLKHLKRSRVQLNRSLCKRIRQLYPDKFFAEQIQRRIEKGRKIRSLLFIATAKALNPRIADRMCLDICLGIEMVHAASCLVDDILDGDDVRHGYQSSQAILGTPVSVLQAHFLCAEAFKLVSRWPEVSESVISTYRKITIGEMYDIFLPEPTADWLCEGYSERIYQKTSAMF